MRRGQCDRPTIRLTIPSATRPRVTRASSSGGDSPPGSPVDMHSVKGILREYDRGAYGEAFRGERLAKIAVLGKGQFQCPLFCCAAMCLRDEAAMTLPRTSMRHSLRCDLLLCCVAGVAPNVSLSCGLVRVRSWKSSPRVRVVMALELYSQ